MTSIVVLWTELASYISACAARLHERYDLDLRVVESDRGAFHPYDENAFALANHRIALRSVSPEDRRRELLGLLATNPPDVALICGWHNPEFRAAARWLKRRGIGVVTTCDNQWRGGVRQWLGGWAARPYLHALFDVVWVPGERAVRLGKHLGYSGESLWRGSYAADTRLFDPVGRARAQEAEAPWPRRFLYTGHLAEHKGVSSLAEAYAKYRKETSDPWELWCAGSGPMERALSGIPGIRLLGFVQPPDYPRVLAQAGAFVLPSLNEPWGVVVQEAMLAGLPVLCSTACGSGVELVQDGYNGFLFEPGSVDELSRLFRHVAGGGVDLRALSEAARRSAQRYSPDAWADYFIMKASMRFGLTVKLRDERIGVAT